MPAQKVNYVTLKNSGGFVVRGILKRVSNGKDSQQSGDITLGATRDFNPSEFGIPAGEKFKLKAFVVWGKDKEAEQELVYDPNTMCTAEYNISGTTQDNTLSLKGYKGA